MTAVNSMTDWGAQSIQAVWFVGPQPIDAAQIFEKLVGAKADNIQQQSVGLMLAFGSDGRRQFRCQTQLGRIDFFQTTLPNPEEDFPFFVPISPALEEFADRLVRINTTLTSVNRLALVTQLHHPVASNEEAARILSENLNFRLPFEDTTDFLFQVNRPIPIASEPALSMNRIMKYQRQTFQMIGIDTAGGPPKIKTGEFIGLEIDINTVPQPALVLTPEQQGHIWSDVKAEAVRLSGLRKLVALA